MYQLGYIILTSSLESVIASELVSQLFKIFSTKILEHKRFSFLPQSNEEQPQDFDFVYADADEYAVEMSELYSYTEEPEFALNRQCFQEDIQSSRGETAILPIIPPFLLLLLFLIFCSAFSIFFFLCFFPLFHHFFSHLSFLHHTEPPHKWTDMDDTQRSNYILGALNRLDSSSRDERLVTARSLLYVAQGVFGECELEEDQVKWTRHNVFLMLECGVFPALIDLLLMEIE